MLLQLIIYLLLSIPVPPPLVQVVPHPNTTQLFTTQQLNITCFTSLHPAVDTAVGVANTWSGPAGVISSDGHVTVVSVAGTNLQFNSALRFSSLRSSDSGTYTCFSVISLVSSYIVGSDSISASVVITASKLTPKRPGMWLYMSTVPDSHKFTEVLHHFLVP